jgi:hypothetical protein
VEVKVPRGQLDLLVAMAQLAQQEFKVILELLGQLVQLALLVDKVRLVLRVLLA